MTTFFVCCSTKLKFFFFFLVVVSLFPAMSSLGYFVECGYLLFGVKLAAPCDGCIRTLYIWKEIFHFVFN